MKIAYRVVFSRFGCQKTIVFDIKKHKKPMPIPRNPILIDKKGSK